jgi:putative membrane protein
MLRSLKDYLINSFKGLSMGATDIVPGSFILSLMSGVLISIFSLMRIINHLLEEHPVLVWSFFFVTFLYGDFDEYPHLFPAVILMLAGFLFILILEQIPSQKPILQNAANQNL